MRIGVLGGGQLGRMLALAGIPMGLDFVLLDQNPSASAANLGQFICGEVEDIEQLSKLASDVDVVTVESENISLSALQQVEKLAPVLPRPKAVAIAQDRLKEKELFTKLNIPTPRFYPADNIEDLVNAAESHGSDMIVKSRRFGYDGKGQSGLERPAHAKEVWNTLGGVPLIAEERIHFSREVSMIAVRDRQGETRFYPLTENLHQSGILLRSEAVIDDPLQPLAENYTQLVMQELDYVGVLTFEFFDCDGELFANEIAPRVHNSGHWTIEGAVTSQFENHLRAIVGWPLGDTTSRVSSVMYNLIGKLPHHVDILSLEGAHLHDYSKSPRPGRKLGHVTLCNPTTETIDQLENMLKI
ncbi:MAG: 5-(carboxyamino)imidazole ribonucleotide synthase [Gammaproteobacteria bacterium]|nr:MAG: 5-(carboxyamino)imidazole ribonucleotide synthase [Gammaproteobacteria bacterium]